MTTNAVDPDGAQLCSDSKDPTIMKPVTNMANPNRARLLDANEDPKQTEPTTDPVPSTGLPPTKESGEPN